MNFTHRHRTRWGLAALAAVVLAAPVAGAQTRGRGKGKQADVQALTAGGPVLKYEQFRRRVEIKVAAKREEQIAGLKRLLELGADPSEVPDIKFRLAELYYEKSQFYFFRSQEAEDQLQKSSDPSRKASLEDDKKVSARESKVWAQRALDVYREIRDGFPKYPRMPEVLFALGQSFWAAGRFDDAVEAYRELITNFKDSPLVADAWLAFGEYYFNEKALHRALKSYEYAAADKRSRVYGFALYKQAWCYYNLADWKSALEKFRATVFYSQMSDELSGENRISLAREAQKDFVRAYAHVGDAGKAKFVLADLVAADDCTGDDCRVLLERLGDLWSEQGKFEDAAGVYAELIRVVPDSTRNPYFQGKVVDLVSRSGDKPRVIRECRRLVDAYNRVTDVVSKMPAGDEATAKAKANVEDARVLAESTVRRLAQLWNREAIKTRQPKTREYALVLYEDYLKLFPTETFAYEMRFQLGDMYYKLERFDDAAQAYRATVEADPKGKYVVEAAEDHVRAVEEHLKDLRLKRPKPGKDKLEIHPQRVRLIEACDMYARAVPADKASKLVGIKFKAAKVYYDHNHFDEALGRFDAIVGAHPDQDEAEYAANLVIDIFNLREDWKQVYEASARYRKNEKLLSGRKKLSDDLNKFGQYAKFKLINLMQEDLEKRGESLAPVAVAYEEFQQEFPDSENADKALFNASVAWDALGEKERADGLRRKLLTDYKDSALRAEVAFYTARRFEEQAMYEKAADLFESFAKSHPEDPRARDALYNASVFYAGIGNVRAATTLRESYLKLYGRQKGGEREAAAIYFTIASDLEQAGKLRNAAGRYADFVKEFPGDDRVYEALWREARIHRKMRRTRDAEKAEQTLYATYHGRKKKGVETPPKAADYASRIAFERVDEDFGKYKKLRIERVNLKNPTAFKRSLANKAKAREQMIAAYTKVVTDYKQAYSTIASLHRIAELWDVFVESLLAVPCPRGLTSEQCTFFKEGLEEQIGPARESAYQAYLQCVAKSNELNVFTGHSTRCVKALEKLAPDRYPVMEERAVGYVDPGNTIDVRSNGLVLKGRSATADAAARAEAER